MGPYLDRLSELLAQGGFVMPPLVASAVLLWYAIGYRLALLNPPGRPVTARRALAQALQGREGRRSVLERACTEMLSVMRTVSGDPRGYLSATHHRYVRELNRFSALIGGLVGTAPLLGLLGTVSGMIETFDSLGTSTLVSSTGGGVAGGISEALFSTQLGLMVAIPGLIVGRLLERRQVLVEDELTKLRESVLIRVEAVQS